MLAAVSRLLRPQPRAISIQSSGPAMAARSKEELRARLTPLQWRVTQLKATERPHSGPYNKLAERGRYHCVVCEQALFESETKYESGCGWPAFFGALEPGRLRLEEESAPVAGPNLLLLASRPPRPRLEVLCGRCDAHLGHRFDDGPRAKGGLRYCINSAALSFRPAGSEAASGAASGAGSGAGSGARSEAAPEAQ